MRYAARGLTDSAPAGELDLGDEERLDVFVRGLSSGVEDGPDEQKPLPFRARTGGVDRHPVQGEAGGLSSPPPGGRTLPQTSDGRGAELEDFGGEGVPFGGRLAAGKRPRTPSPWHGARGVLAGREGRGR